MKPYDPITDIIFGDEDEDDEMDMETLFYITGQSLAIDIQRSYG